MSQQLIELELKELHLNPNNPSTRNPDKELIASIKDIGIRTPLLVKKNDKGYVIIAGERRYKSAIELKLKTVPVLIQSDLATETDSTLLLLADNVHRTNMNMYEEFQVIATLLKTLSVAEVAKKLNKSSQYVVRRTGLENLAPEVIKGIQNNTAGLTERIVFIFARIPKKLQKELWESGTEEYKVGEKNAVHFVWTEEYLEYRVKRDTTDAFFSGELAVEDVLRIVNDKAGKVNIEKALDNVLDEKNALIAPTVFTDEQKSATKKLLKEISEADQLSISAFTVSGVTPKDQWREATKQDDPKSIKDGIIVDGPKAGMLVSYMKLNPRKEQKDGKLKSEKQIEKERAERKEKRFNNEVESRSVATLFATLEETFPKMTINQEMANFLFSQMPQSWKNRTLRQMIGQEEYSKTSFDKASAIVSKRLKSYHPAQQVLFVALAQAVPYAHEQIAAAAGISLADIRKKHVAELKSEQKKTEDAKLAEKARKESDSKAKAKQKK